MMKIRVYTEALRKYAPEVRPSATSGYVMARPFYEGYEVSGPHPFKYLWLQCHNPFRVYAIPHVRILHVEQYVKVEKLPQAGVPE
jgi:hypothetical protein